MWCSQCGGSAGSAVRLAKSEQQLHKLTYEDPLTGLPNHRQLLNLFDRAIIPRAGDETLAYVTIDLDGFDEVNDAVGHAGGDEVLVEIANRLREAAPAGAQVGRLGSDEFALIMADADREKALQAADALRQAVARPIGTSQVVQVVASIGLAVAPQDGTTRDELTRRADLALRAAKRRRQGGAVAFAAEMETELQERRFIEGELARALAGRAFELYYQPIVKAERAATAGLEALLRWNHPTRGLIPPSVFVPVAEAAGLMDKLGEFVLRRAIADAGRWPDLYVSVNVSPVQIRDRAFVDVVSAALGESGFEPARLVLEVTEGALIENPDETAARLLELRALGVRLALDDFGSGYSSLNDLRRLPFDKVKIDRELRRRARPVGKRRGDHPGGGHARAGARHGRGDRRDRDRAAARAGASSRAATRCRATCSRGRRRRRKSSGCWPGRHPRRRQGRLRCAWRSRSKA